MYEFRKERIRVTEISMTHIFSQMFMFLFIFFPFGYILGTKTISNHSTRLKGQEVLLKHDIRESS